MHAVTLSFALVWFALCSIQEQGISVEVWKPRMALKAGIALVSVEDAVEPSFLYALRSSQNDRELARIVFDEVHLVQDHASFREAMSRVWRLAQLEVPFVWLTATMPPAKEEMLARSLKTNFRTMRERTSRPDVEYVVVDGNDNIKRSVFSCIITSFFERFWQHDKTTRCIVYCLYKQEAMDFADEFRLDTGQTCSVLHAEMSDEDKKDAYDCWKGGQHPIMFATQAFGAGIDYPSVRLVLHVGMPTSLSGFAQESGRLSRDGAGGLAYVMTSSQVRRRYMAINEDDEDGEYS